jgi:nucleotide-binding universal stress UspA family protein
MAKRVLMVITPARAGDLVSAARSAAAVARESGGAARMAWMRPLPAPRVDRYDRIVADAEREMARLTAAALDEMAALAREFGGLDVERVVRFGRLTTELLIEAHAWRADLIGLAAPERPGPGHRFRAWYLARAVSIPVVLLPIDRPGTGHRRREPVALPAF